MKKDAYYFPHFSNARGDRKIKRLMKDLGLEGYGIYFMTLEVLREQPNFKYPLGDLDLLADEMRTSEAKLKAVIKSYDLFEKDEEENFFSPKLILYLQPYLEKSKRAQLAAKKRWNKVKEVNQNDAKAYAKALPEHCNSESKGNADQNARKVKESKVKESKVNDNKKNDEKNDEKKGLESSSLKNTYKFYENNFGLRTKHIDDEISSYLDDGIEEGMIIKALEISLENNVNTWKYAKSIIEAKTKRNIKTLAEFNIDEDNYKNKNVNTKNKTIQEKMMGMTVDTYKWGDEYK